MVTHQDFPDDAVAAARAVLLEVMTVLGTYRKALVLVGGWVPEFMFPNAGHVGSLDIDLALDEAQISGEEYDTILKLLEEAGYRKGDRPNQFHRDVTLENGKTVSVRVDLLAPEYGGSGRSNRHQQIQDLKIRKARGADLAFDHPMQLQVDGVLPNGGKNTADVQVAAIAPFLVMKGMALFNRLKEKDAYDISFCVEHYPGGIEKLAEEFRPWLSNGLVKEGLGKIRAKFATVDAIGPTWTVQFLDVAGEDAEIEQRGAFERVSKLLDLLSVESWEQPRLD